MLEDYNHKRFNLRIRAIRDGNYTDEEKAQLVYEERERLLSVLTNNVKSNRLSGPDILSERLQGLLTRVLVAGPRKNAQEDLASMQKDSEYRTNRKRSHAMEFARALFNAPLFTTIDDY